MQGWNWVDEGRDGRHKYDYVTEEPDHDIIFVVGSMLPTCNPPCFYDASRRSVQKRAAKMVSRLQLVSTDTKLCDVIKFEPVSSFSLFTCVTQYAAYPLFSRS